MRRTLSDEADELPRAHDEIPLPRDRRDFVFHAALLAPYLSGLSFALNIVGIKPAGILHFDYGLSPVVIFDDEIGNIPSLVLLPVDPRDGNPVPFDPLLDAGVRLKARHHATFEFAVETLEVVGALPGVPEFAAITDRHIG